MRNADHKPYYRGYECVCSDCGRFLYDVRTGRKLRTLEDVDPILLGAVEARWTGDPDLAQRLAHEDMREVVSTYKLADKFNDFLMNPKARPDLQTPEAQDFLGKVKNKYLNAKTDELMPWVTREWKKGRIRPHPSGMPGLQYQGHPDYNYYDNDGNETNWHNLNEGEMDHWGDWYRSDHPSRKGKDIMQMKSPDMHQTIRDWDTDMRNRADSEAQSRGDVLHHFDDGWNVQQLRTPRELTDEGDSMGHCVGSYAQQVQDGHSLVYSLRDHNNQPHATWEVTPKQWQDTEGKTYNGFEPDGIPAEAKPVPQGGTMEQIQGKGNEPPIPAYQARIKEYMEHAMPNPDERPKWDAQDYGEDSLDDLMDPEGQNGYVAYHPGDYGLATPDTTYDWPALLNRHIGWNEYTPKDFVKKAVEHGQFEPMAKEAENNFEGRRNAMQEERKYEWQRYIEPEFQNSFNESDPEPQPEDVPYNEGDYDSNGYNKAWEDWEKREEEARNNDIKGYYDEREHSPEENQMDELEVEIAAQRRREQEASQQAEPVVSKTASRQSHPNFTTGEPCHCTFYKPPQEWQVEAVFMDKGQPDVCPTCGEPTTHGQCQRCDWGQWSNAMGPGDNNPSDPTKELKPSITEASTQRWRPA